MTDLGQDKTLVWFAKGNSKHKDEPGSILVSDVTSLAKCREFCVRWSLFECKAVEYDEAEKTCRLWKDADEENIIEGENKVFSWWSYDSIVATYQGLESFQSFRSLILITFVLVQQPRAVLP